MPSFRPSRNCGADLPGLDCFACLPVLMLGVNGAGAVGLSAAALLAAQQADAASEVSELAAGDNRFGIILVLGLPVIGWVLFNILGPAKAQLDNMGGKRRGIAGACVLALVQILGSFGASDMVFVYLMLPYSGPCMFVYIVGRNVLVRRVPTSWQGIEHPCVYRHIHVRARCIHPDCLLLLTCMIAKPALLPPGSQLHPT